MFQKIRIIHVCLLTTPKLPTNIENMKLKAVVIFKFDKPS